MLRIERRTGSLVLIGSSLFRDDRIGRSFATVLLLIATLASPGCGGGGGGNPPPSTLLSIAVTPANSDLPVGLTQQLRATGTFSDASTADLTGMVSWTSSKPAFATVGAASGVATSIALGSTVITATSSSVSGSATLIVTPAALQSIVITPNAPSTEIGAATQLIAAGKYSDSTTANVTTTVNWASSMPSVATVGSATGLATGVSVGSATISATAGSISATILLSVVPKAWSSTGSMSSPRYAHTATLLSDGKVLVVGGNGPQSAITETTLASSELYDPVSGAWTVTGSLKVARHAQTATLLHNGTVLIAGGDDFANGGGSTFASAEIYDPAAGSWTPTASLASARTEHTATLLPNGTVLVAGGSVFNTIVGPLSPSVLASAEIYDPVARTWTPTGSLATARASHTATLLPNGTVFVAGGSNTSSVVSSAEIYDPAAGTWTPTGSLSTVRALHTATLLPNGTVLVAGGLDKQGLSLSSSEIYDPGAGSWRTTGRLYVSRYTHTATLLPSGTVLVVAGDSSGASGGISGMTPTAEIYNPVSGTWTSTGSLGSGRDGHTATLLPNGTALIAGGRQYGGKFEVILGDAVIYY
jgi:N-acetylneuraminic acid mutarotase